MMTKNDIKLTKVQWDLLDRICRTNGGGIYAGLRESKAMMSLHEKGLIQGKMGHASLAVHTREGLLLWRKRNAATTAG